MFRVVSRLEPFVSFFLLAQQPPVGQGLLIHEVSRSQTTTRHSRQDSSGRVINPSQRSLPDNIQHSQQTNIHAPGGIRTHILRRRAAADLRFSPRGHWDRRLGLYVDKFYPQSCLCSHRTDIDVNFHIAVIICKFGKHSVSPPQPLPTYFRKNSPPPSYLRLRGWVVSCSVWEI